MLHKTNCSALFVRFNPRFCQLHHAMATLQETWYFKRCDTPKEVAYTSSPHTNEHQLRGFLYRKFAVEPTVHDVLFHPSFEGCNSQSERVSHDSASPHLYNFCIHFMRHPAHSGPEQPTHDRGLHPLAELVNAYRQRSAKFQATHETLGKVMRGNTLPASPARSIPPVPRPHDPEKTASHELRPHKPTPEGTTAPDKGRRKSTSARVNASKRQRHHKAEVSKTTTLKTKALTTSWLEDHRNAASACRCRYLST